MIIFAVFPVAPPRLMPGYDFIDTVTLRSNSYRVLQPSALANPYAAMPSLHFGWDLLMGIALVREASRPAVRALGFVLPVGMFLAVVLTANHYILDAVVGGSLVLISLYIVILLSRFNVQFPDLASHLRRTPSSARTVVSITSDGATGAPPRLTTLNPVTPDGQEGPVEAFDASRVLTQRPFVVAHRFGHELSTLRAAERAGVDIVEADVWRFRGQLEVRHSKTLGPAPILWDRWSIERSRAPRFQLEDLLRGLDPHTSLMIDVKGRDPQAAEHIINTLDLLLPGRPILVCSQNWSQLDRFREFQQAMRVHSIGNHWQLRRAWRQLGNDDHAAVSIQGRLLNAQVVRALKGSVPFVMTWPVNSAQRLEQVLDWGVDGFTSDNLELMTGFIRRRTTPTARRQPATSD
jgi:glycerophosphoryl diester phosphodiesterase